MLTQTKGQAKIKRMHSNKTIFEESERSATLTDFTPNSRSPYDNR